MAKCREVMTKDPASCSASETVTKVAHPDANIIFGAVIDDALGDEVRVTVIAAGFDKLGNGKNGGKLARVLEAERMLGTSGQRTDAPAEREAAPSLLEEEDEMFKPAQRTVVFDAEDDLDIPDFLKS